MRNKYNPLERVLLGVAHRQVIPMLANAMRNLQQTEGYSEAAIVQWLDAFFLSRIGTVPGIADAGGHSKYYKILGIWDVNNYQTCFFLKIW